MSFKVEMSPKKRKFMKDTLIDALLTDGEHHKQYALELCLKTLIGECGMKEESEKLKKQGYGNIWAEDSIYAWVSGVPG